MRLARVVKADLDGLSAAASVVREGGLVCYPTDTVYGLGCDPLNFFAVEKIRAVKGGRTRAMPVLVHDITAALKLAYFSGVAMNLAEKFWPGPLTIVLPAKDILPSVLVPDRTVGLRSPNHGVCLELLELCTGFLVGTSANLTGHPPAKSVQEAIRALGDRVDLILDGGISPVGVPSTVVDLSKSHLRVLREGPIGKAEILQCLKVRRAR